MSVCVFRCLSVFKEQLIPLFIQFNLRYCLWKNEKLNEILVCEESFSEKLASIINNKLQLCGVVDGKISLVSFSLKKWLKHENISTNSIKQKWVNNIEINKVKKERYLIRQHNKIYKFSIKLYFLSIGQEKSKLQKQICKLLILNEMCINLYWKCINQNCSCYKAGVFIINNWKIYCKC